MITSHEEQSEYFFQGIKMLAQKLDIDRNLQIVHDPDSRIVDGAYSMYVEPQYLMQDTSRASFDAVRKCYPSTIV